MKASRKVRPLTAAVSALGLVAILAAACGSSGGGSSTSTSTTSGGTQSSSFKLSSPVKFVLLAEIAGESSVAVNDYWNAARMAVGDINAAGGIGGQKVQLIRYPAPLTPAGSVSAYLKAEQAQPTAIVGFPANFQAVAAAQQIKQAGIPFICPCNVDPSILRNGKLGSPSLYILRAADGITSAKDQGEFVVNNLHAKKVAILYADTPSNVAAVAAAKSAVQSAGGQVVYTHANSITATDLTSDVLSLKSDNADVVLDLDYPNQEAILLQEMLQNGEGNIPVVSATSAETLVTNNLAKGAALNNLYGDLDCNVVQRSPGWSARYQKTYHEAAADISAGTYDAFRFLAAAIESAKSTTPSAVEQAMNTIHYTKAVCSADMHADSTGVLQHGTVMVYFGHGQRKTVETYAAGQ